MTWLLMKICGRGWCGFKKKKGEGKGGGIGWLQSSARKTAAKELYSWTFVCRRWTTAIDLSNSKGPRIHTVVLFVVTLAYLITGKSHLPLTVQGTLRIWCFPQGIVTQSDDTYTCMITVTSKELYVFKSVEIENPLEYHDQTPCEGSATFHSVHRTCHSIEMKFVWSVYGILPDAASFNWANGIVFWTQPPGALLHTFLSADIFVY